LVRGHSVAGLLPVNILEPDDIELPLIHYNSKDYKQAIRDTFTGHFSIAFQLVIGITTATFSYLFHEN
jgi:hypothetical protein